MNFEKIYDILVISQFLSAPVVFLILTFISAPYGKHSRMGWGKQINSRTAWVLMELPAVFMILTLYLLNINNFSFIPLFFLFFWQFHYIYRTFIFPFLIRGSKKTFPILLVFFAFIFNCMNGFINGYYLFFLNNNYPETWVLNPKFIIGLLIFISGFVLHTYSDKIIRSLRKPEETGYKIPMKGPFKLVSNPNYLGEIIEWSGWAVMTWSLPGFAFAVFTFANLFPRAIQNHRWYKSNFPDFPEKRKIIIPYIF